MRQDGAERRRLVGSTALFPRLDPEDLRGHRRLSSLLHGAGRAHVQILLTKNEETVEQQVSDDLKDRSYDVIVVGVGLRTLPPVAVHFERLINVLHEKAPRTKLAFNSKPDDSDAAALRWL